MLVIPDSCSYTITDKSQFTSISDSEDQPILRVQSVLTPLLSLDALSSAWLLSSPSFLCCFKVIPSSFSSTLFIHLSIPWLLPSYTLHTPFSSPSFPCFSCTSTLLFFLYYFLWHLIFISMMLINLLTQYIIPFPMA